ncbi:MAG: Gfo/Idh/MocA family protein [Opitutaceae bacterium]
MNTPPLSTLDQLTETNISRRGFIGAAATGLAATALSSSAIAQAAETAAGKHGTIRWGFVGTGSIANAMAKTLRLTPAGQLVASSSRTLEKAEAFAEKHGASKAFDSWQEMLEWDGIDAVYVATPTSVREEICVAAANAGKHVIGEKPFASLSSVQRITAACQKNKVAFMDGTHFSHHPRTTTLRSQLDTLIGERRNVDSVFQFNIRDSSNIRMQPKLEPMGAIGDAGWYNMRAIVEYIDSGAELEGVSTYIRRGAETGAVIGATGVVAFKDGSISTWSCGFDAGSGRADLRIDGNLGNVDMERFLSQDKDNSASYHYRSRNGRTKRADETIKIESSLPGSALMFENFSAQVHDPSLRAQWAQKTARTQELLDAVWDSGIQNEQA